MLPPDTIQANEKGAYNSYKLSELGAGDSYKLMMGSVIPRPIAFVSTIAANGTVNLAPFSNFMVVTASKGIIAIGVGGDGASTRDKDTYLNIDRAREFVVNLASVPMAAIVQQCSNALPPGVSEAEDAGLTLLPSVAIATPRIAECKVQFECKLNSMLAFGKAHLIVGEVQLAHVRSDIIADYKIDPNAYEPLGRIGGRRYCALGGFIDV